MAFVTALTLTGLPSVAADKKANLLNNPSFEEEVPVNIPKLYQRFLDAGIQLPSDGIMPVGVYLNFADNWEANGSGKQVEYVKGKPGEEVHTGSRAFHVVAKANLNGFVVGGSPELTRQGEYAPNAWIEVSDSPDPNNPSLVQKKTHRFEFYAKGRGTVDVRTYAYTKKKQAIPPQEYQLTHEPKTGFKILEPDDWQKFEGTLQLDGPDVAFVYFAMRVNGDVYVDDVALYTE